MKKLCALCVLCGEKVIIHSPSGRWIMQIKLLCFSLIRNRCGCLGHFLRITEIIMRQGF
jgi:hypothetical protein